MDNACEAPSPREAASAACAAAIISRCNFVPDLQVHQN